MKKAGDKIIDVTGICIGLLCVMIAGSDGPYFPWMNFGALILLICIVTIAGARDTARRMRSTTLDRERPWVSR
jgi:hypothetical protein